MHGINVAGLNECQHWCHQGWALRLYFSYGSRFTNLLMLKDIKCVHLFYVYWSYLEFLAVGNANQYYGDGVINPYLGSNGWCYFDWYRPPELAKQRSTLERGGQIKLQARFMWMGAGSVPYVENKTGEHAILGLTQGTIVGSLGCAQKGYSENLVNSPAHPGDQQWIHRYGVGVLVSPKGLNLELWNGDGTSYLWNQTNNRCAILVPSGAQAGMC